MTIDFFTVNLVSLYLLRKHKQRFVSANTYLHNTNKKHLSFKSILSLSMSDMVSGQLPLKKIASLQYPPGNYLWGKLPFRCFVAYIMPLGLMVPRKTAPRKIVPRITYTRDIFLLQSIVVSSCFPSLWFKLVLDLDFCIRKRFIYI